MLTLDAIPDVISRLCRSVINTVYPLMSDVMLSYQVTRSLNDGCTYCNHAHVGQKIYNYKSFITGHIPVLTRDRSRQKSERLWSHGEHTIKSESSYDMFLSCTKR